MPANPELLELVPIEEQIVKKKIFVGIALDQSGSMMCIKNETMSGVNEQIDDIRTSAKNADVSVSLIAFSAKPEWKYFNESIEKLEKLSDDNYWPDGGTAMHSAVGMLTNRLYNEVKDLNKDSYSVLIIVISDGQNNVNDLEYTPAIISKRTKELQDGGNWTFTYVGANQDLTKIEHDLGIKQGNIMAFTSDVGGTNKGFVDYNSRHRTSLRSYVAQATSLNTRGAHATSVFYDPRDSVDERTATEKTEEQIEALRSAISQIGV